MVLLDSGAAKRPRRTRAHLREMVLDAGKQVLLEIDPNLGFDQLSYAMVFDYLREHRGEKVTRASVHERIWPTQRAFQLEVLKLVVADGPPMMFEISQSGALESLAAADLTKPATRRYAAQDVTRLIQNAQWVQGGAVTRHELIAITARFRYFALPEDHEEKELFRSIVLGERERAAELYGEMIGLLMETIGMRFRVDVAPAGMDALVVLGRAAANMPLVDPMPQTNQFIELPTGLNGELETWHSTAIGVWSLVRGMLELDGDDLTEEQRHL